ncbi:MAG: membrane protein insertase YidC [Desulfobacterales bacterium]|nr:membrane protein insertase YidC [Desulfobacterales bacterium]
MEQVRLILAIVLSFLVLVFWNYFFVETPQVQQEKDKLEQPNQESVDQQQLTNQTINSTSSEVAKTTYPVDGSILNPPRTIVVNSPLYTLEISEKDATLNRFMLKHYREHSDKDSPNKELISHEMQQGILQFFLENNMYVGAGAEHIQYKASTDSDVLEVTDKEQELTFFGSTSNGLIIKRSYRFINDSYVIDHVITIQNNSSIPIQDRGLLKLSTPLPKKDATYGFEGPCALVDDSLKQINIKDIDPSQKIDGRFSWMAIVDRYFMMSVIPTNSKESGMKIEKDNRFLFISFLSPMFQLQQGKSETIQIKLFIGPKRVDILKKLGSHLDKAVDFGWFDIIAKPCLWLMNFLYSFIPNYGIAIILLTILIKIIFWPLGSKSYRSMNEMKKLQPLVAELQVKYKNDKRKLNEAMLDLYKTYKVNPFSGCLPVLVQLPIFIALYRMLYEAIELRHAPFFGWISDLSAPDRLFHFNFQIPFMEAPYGIPVLTIIMGLTMFIQQKMSPPVGDPTQAKMMMFMPLIFTFIFINFSSGLVLYWLVNNIFSIAQQYYTTKSNS